MRASPIWFLDVDGVINAAGPASDGRCETRDVVVRGWPVTIRFDPVVIQRVNALSRHVQVRWLTTWADEAVTVLAPAVGLAAFDVCHEVGLMESHSAMPRGRDANPWWKLVSVLDQVERAGPRAVVWTDDDIDDDVRAVVAERGGPPSLLLRPDPTVGLTMAELDRIEQFIDHLHAA